MPVNIAVVHGSDKERDELCSALRSHGFRVTKIHSLGDLKVRVRSSRFKTAILDLDSLPVTNRLFEEIRSSSPDLRVIGLSSRTFHPELREAMSTHISACLVKPLDLGELIYWLKDI